jgi:hypothetical protein
VEPDTVNTPKINKSTFSFGGSLMKRVSNNERKITVLKNIIRTQRNNIGEKITPKMSSLQESLMVTNEVLVDIARQLEQDFDSRVVEKKSLLQKNRAEKLEIRRQQVLEEKAENKQTEKTVKTAARKTIKPLGNIFGKVFELIKILGTGLLINAVVGNFDKIIGFFSGDTFKNIQAKLTQAYQLINKHMGLIVAVGAGLVALSLAGTIANIVSVGSGLIGILTNPVVLAGLGILVSFAALSKIGKEVFDAKVEGAENSVDELKKEGLDQGTAEILTDLASPKDLDGNRILEGYGPPTTTNIDGDIGGNSFLPFMLNQDLNKNLKLDDNDVSSVEFQDMPPIDMREEKKADRYLEPGGNTGTKVVMVSSFNSMNNYMKETPSLFGFSDLVYT